MDSVTGGLRFKCLPVPSNLAKAEAASIALLARSCSLQIHLLGCEDHPSAKLNQPFATTITGHGKADKDNLFPADLVADDYFLFPW